MNHLAILAQSSSSGADSALGGIIVLVFLLFYLAIIVLVLAGMWKVFTKAGQPGWAAIIPIYNIYIILKIIGQPWWWLLVMFIPFIGIVAQIIMCIGLAKSFGRSVGTILGLIFLFPIFICILGFGSAKYLGPTR